MKRIGTARRKTRAKFTKNVRERGKISLSKYFQTFKDGETVRLEVESAVQKGMYHPRFMGLSGKVAGRKGKCYNVVIKDHNKEKTLIVHPVHLKRI